MAKRVPYLLLILVSAGLLSCDLATKAAANDELKGQRPVMLIAGLLDLRYTENRDVGFSLLRRIPPQTRKVVIIASNCLVTSLLLLLWIRRRRGPALEQAAYAVILAGALGNLIDRLLRGHVVDFIYLHYWPVFNVADICLVAGAGLLMLAALRRTAREPGS